MSRIDGVALRCVSTAVPRSAEGMSEWTARYGERQVAKVHEATGIREVRIASTATSTLDLATAASLPVMEWAESRSERVEGIIVATQTPQRAAPGVAHSLARVLDLAHECFCVDINHGCSAYPYTLSIAGSLISSGLMSTVLVVVADTITKFTDPEDYRTRMVFGDAGAATLVTTGVDSWSFASGADGAGEDALCLKSSTPGIAGNWLHMDGLAVMNFTLERVPGLMDSLRTSEQGIGRPATFDSVVLHQANQFIVKTLERKVGRQDERFVHAYQRFGNTGPASIPVAIVDAMTDGSVLGRTAMLGFGIGLSWAGVVADLSETEVLPLIELS